VVAGQGVARQDLPGRMHDAEVVHRLSVTEPNGNTDLHG
jgi:hypothetical protein